MWYAAVAAFGVGAKRSDGKLPAHVTAYLTMALCLFTDDDYEEVATKVTGSLSKWGCWDADWSVPTASGITQARKRLDPQGAGGGVRAGRGSGGNDVDAGSVAAGVAAAGDRRVRRRRARHRCQRWRVRLCRVRGEPVGVPKARVVALAECGTHAFLAAEVGAFWVGEKTLANRLYQRLRCDELLTADRNFYSFTAWDLASRSGAGLLWRAPTGLGLPIVNILSDGTYLSVLINPSIAGPDTARRSSPPPARSPPVGLPSSTPPRRTWYGSWSTTCPTVSATAPAN
ncbi:MAG: transposase domain-containing protein [Actinobacteria bacterium]|nr:transposase domain-containing protein [Actinomycetota bacterium]